MRRILVLHGLFASSCGVDVDATVSSDECGSESPEVPGECSTSDDCISGGCSGEVCTAVSSVEEGWATACEWLACYENLDECACEAGVCRWQ